MIVIKILNLIPKEEKDNHEINHNRDNRNRYREPDFEFQGILILRVF